MPRSTAGTPDRTIHDDGSKPQRVDRAVDALDAHLSLIAWLGTESALQTFMRYSTLVPEMEHVDIVGSDGLPVQMPAMKRRRLVARLSAEMRCKHMSDRFPGEPTYYVTEEMARVAAAAAADLEPCPVLMPQDLPSPSGFLYFAVPLRFADYGSNLTEPRTARVRALEWCDETVAWRGDGGVEEHLPGVSYTMWCETAHIREDWEWTRSDAPDKWWPWEMSAWSYGVTYEIDDDIENRKSGYVIPECEWQRRFMVAIWNLMQQEIVHVGPGWLDRAARRRMKRQQDTTPNFGDVKVVRLRRSYNPILEMMDQEEISSKGEREWACRWPVRGHWRNQPYGPGRTERKRIWIPPHIKGPQDKPLIIKDTIYSLER